MSDDTLLSTIYANGPDLPSQVEACIARGADFDLINDGDDTALRVASDNGRFDVVAMLIDAGANWYELGWTHTIERTVFGTPEDIRASVLRHGDLEQTDFWNRTPLLIAILMGDIARVQLLLDLGADAAARGRHGKTAPVYAVQRGDLAMLQWLAAHGFDMDATDDAGRTPLMEAARLGQVECLRLLATLGVDLHKTTGSDKRAMALATDQAVVRALVACGDEPAGLTAEAHADLAGIEYDGEPACDRASLTRDGARVFGTANPERTDHPFWLEMIRCGATAWRARDRIGGDEGLVPLWCYQRYGRSTTILADGRIVDIGGEHEDFYDPDFCIYNDVTVFDGKGGIAIYSYPQSDFPPTDFHSATLAGNYIYIIGCLGYANQRRPGTTPVFRLDLSSFRITAVAAAGQCPGWIHGHRARLLGQSIVVSGGSIEDGGQARQSRANEEIYCLCLNTFTWTCLPPS